MTFMTKGPLREVDMLVVERVFEMSGGWVLGLSDEKFAKLMAEHSVDINDAAYLVDGDSNSKAKRFRRYLSAAEPRQIADVLAGLL